MSSIPIIGDIIEAGSNVINWIINTSPPYFKVAVFLGILTTVVLVGGFIFDNLGLSHRIMKPQICGEAVAYINNYTLVFSGSIENSTSVAGTEGQVNSCIMNISNNTCGDCSFINSGISGKLSLICYTMSNPYLYRPMCAHTVFTDSSGLTSTYFAYCTQSQSEITVNQQEYANALSINEKCKNMGFDFLNYRVLFVATMMSLLIGFAMDWKKTNG